MKNPIKKPMAALVAMMAAGAFFLSCNTEEIDTNTPFITVAQTTVEAPANGGDVTLAVTSNRPWLLENIPGEWLIADKTSGSGDATITLTLAPNTGITREADIRIATQTVYENVRITQPGSIAAEVLYADDFGNGVAASPWPSVADYTGWNKTGTGAANVTYAEEGGAASVRNNSNSTGYDGASGQCNVMMAANGAGFLVNGIDLTGMTNMMLSFGSNENSGTLTLYYNTDGGAWTEVPYTKTDNPAKWGLVEVEFNVPAGSSVLNLKFTAGTSGYGTRIDDIKLVGTSGAPAGDLSVSPAALSFAAAEETKTFSITSTKAWAVSSSDAWCTVGTASGSDNATINVTAAAHTGTAPRSATITITTDNPADTRTVAVTQAAPGAGANAIYYEDVGKTAVTANTNFASFPADAWSKEGSGASGVTYEATGAISIRTSIPSTGLYEGASGGNRVFFGTAPSAFIVKGIALSNVNSVALSFGASKVANVSGSNVWADFTGDLTLSYSSDGGTQWVPVSWTFSAAPADGSTVTWALASADIPTAGVSSLSLKWDCTVASIVRIDDIKVVPSSGTPGSYLNVSPAAATFTDAGGAQTVTITSNTTWTITEDAAATWCTVTPSLTGSDNGAFTITTTANTTTLSRSATITISGTGVTPDKTVAVTQAGVSSGTDLVKISLAGLSTPATLYVDGSDGSKVERVLAGGETMSNLSYTSSSSSIWTGGWNNAGAAWLLTSITATAEIYGTITVSFNAFGVNASPRNWLMEYSNDNTTWHSGATYAITSATTPGDAISETITIPEADKVSAGGKLYIRLMPDPSSTTSVNGSAIGTSNVNSRLASSISVVKN